MLKQYKVWDAPTRLFHWINFVSVVLLFLIGMLMRYKKYLAITAYAPTVEIKELHVLIGYVFVLNLLSRLVWGVIGNRFARWNTILPGRGFGDVVAAYVASIKRGQKQQFLGHNPMGRLAVTFMMMLLIIMAVTGLIRAGTDVYYPPFGSIFAAQVAAEGVDPATLKPYDKTGTDAAKLKALIDFKHIYGEVHYDTFLILMAMILLHLVVVIRMEIAEGNGLISAMFSGNKILSRKPEDLDG